EGSPVLLMVGEEELPFVLTAEGEQLWSADEEDEVYLDGVVVRYPDEWSVDDPGGDFTVLDTDGEELWSYTFAPDEEDEDTDEEAGETEGDEDSDEEPSFGVDRKSTRLNSSHVSISYAVFCLKKKTRRSLRAHACS